MADDKRKPASREAGTGTGTGTGTGAKGTAAGSRRGEPPAPRASTAARGGSGASRGSSTASASAAADAGAALGGAAGATMGGAAGATLADASEPLVVVESLTVLSETPLEVADVDDAGGGPEARNGAVAAPDGSADGQQRWLLIAERAYLRASERGFAPGGELDDWLNAEREVDAQLGGG
jgi:hypothetical protein